MSHGFRLCAANRFRMAPKASHWAGPARNGAILPLEGRVRDGLTATGLREARGPCPSMQRDEHEARSRCAKERSPPDEADSNEREVRAAAGQTPIASAEGHTHEREPCTPCAKGTRRPVDACTNEREPRAPAAERCIDAAEAET